MSLPPDFSPEQRGIPQQRYDISRTLSDWYTAQTTYAKEAWRQDGKIFVTHTVLPEQVDPSIRAMLRGEIQTADQMITNRVTVGSPHTEGHFKSHLRLFPGWEGTAMIVEAVQKEDQYWLTAFDSIRFSKPAVPGDVVIGHATLVGFENGTVLVNGRTAKEDAGRREFHTYAQRMMFEEASGQHPEGVLLQAQWLEVLAQMAGAAAIVEKGDPARGMVPVFLGVGKTWMAKEYIRSGDELLGETEIIDEDSFGIDDTNVTILLNKNGKEIAGSQIRLGFVPLQPLIAAIRGEGK